MEKIGYFFAGIAALLLLWVAVSYIDIISDNIAQDPQHSNINAFVLLLDFMEDK